MYECFQDSYKQTIIVWLAEPRKDAHSCVLCLLFIQKYMNYNLCLFHEKLEYCCLIITYPQPFLTRDIGSWGAVGAFFYVP